mmetsp:Transcript_18978/g.26140  ORF Transcript_18978/g.26140 Transcript_18978/m.26140 type:complete len:86 (-) Transcript_18978:167-424(-)
MNEWLHPSPSVHPPEGRKEELLQVIFSACINWLIQVGRQSFQRGSDRIIGFVGKSVLLSRLSGSQRERETWNHSFIPVISGWVLD